MLWKKSVKCEVLSANYRIYTICWVHHEKPFVHASLEPWEKPIEPVQLTSKNSHNLFLFTVLDTTIISFQLRLKKPNLAFHCLSQPSYQKIVWLNKLFGLKWCQNFFHMISKFLVIIVPAGYLPNVPPNIWITV